MNTASTNRRTFLRGLGACLALPALESFGAPSSKMPTNLAYLYFPNGTAEGSWEPEKVGPNQQLLKLNQWMAPLEPFKVDITIPTRMWTPRGNGHSAGTATWLTGGGFNRKNVDVGGPSVDQIAANHLKSETPLPSLEISTVGEGNFAGDLSRNCLSWTSRNVPAFRETVPRAIFDKLFRKADEGFVNRSVLDLVLEQSKSLKSRASAADGQKIDEYLEAVRTMERRVEFAEQQTKRAAADRALTDTLRRPAAGIPTNYEEYVRQLLELQALAFWSGATRVSTFMLDHGQSNRYFNFIPGVEGTWHALSHWKNASGRTEDDDGVTKWKDVTTKRDQYNAVTRWHHQQVAFFLGKLKEMKASDGQSVLEHSMIVYGSSLSDGHEHGAHDLPIILAGGGSGTLKPGRLLEHGSRTSMSSLHFGLLQRMGVELGEFADSSESLTGI
ncbi:MAG: DUF1552 domain-containing protein [Verrucomicrobiota bacterium]